MEPGSFSRTLAHDLRIPLNIQTEVEDDASEGPEDQVSQGDYGTGGRPDFDHNGKFRNWVFTIQGWNEDTLTRLLAHEAWKYVIVGKEIGETGSKHYQGFGCFRNPRSYPSMLRLLNGAWCEPALNVDASINYCKKDGDYREAGKQPRTLEEQTAGLYDLLTLLQDSLESDDDHRDPVSEAIEVSEDIQNALDELMISINETHPYLQQKNDLDYYEFGAL